MPANLLSSHFLACLLSLTYLKHSSDCLRSGTCFADSRFDTATALTLSVSFIPWIPNPGVVFLILQVWLGNLKPLEMKVSFVGVSRFHSRNESAFHMWIPLSFFLPFLEAILLSFILKCHAVRWYSVMAMHDFLEYFHTFRCKLNMLANLFGREYSLVLRRNSHLRWVNTMMLVELLRSCFSLRERSRCNRYCFVYTQC